MRKGMNIFLTVIFMISAVLVAPLWGKEKEAVKPADFYKGKTLEIVVPYSAGGGYDTYARVMEPFLKKYIGVDVAIVKNMPGAGASVGYNYLMKVAKKDGLTLGLGPGGVKAAEQILGVPGVEYDAGQFIYLAQVSSEARMFMVGAQSPYRKIADLQAAKNVIKLGATSLTDGPGMGVTTAAHVLKLNAKVVAGYKGAKEVALATMQGEVDGWSSSESLSYKMSKAGDLAAIFTTRKERAKLFPDTPTIYEGTKFSDEDKLLLDVFMATDGVYRVMLAPPGVPQDRIAFLREGLRKALSDPEMLASGEQKDSPFLYLSGEEVKREIDKILGVKGKNLEYIKFVWLEKYAK